MTAYPTYRSTSVGDGNTGVPVTAPLPAGAVEGDLLLLQRSSLNNQGAIAGWTAITNVFYNIHTHWFWRVATAGDVTAGTLDLGSVNASTSVWVHAFADPDAVSPVQVAASVGTSGTSGVAAPSVTTTGPALLVSLVADSHFNGSSVYTAPSGMTLRHTGGDATGSYSGAMATETRPTAGATGTRQWNAPQPGTAGYLAANVALNETPNVAPNAPTLVSPVGGVSVDLAATNRLSWTPSDDDAGDSQSKFDLRYRKTGVATNEIQTVSITGSPTGGTFTLTYSGQTTAAIAYDATAAAVRSALEALSNIAVQDVAVSGGPLPDTAVTVTFQGALGSTNVAEMTATGSLTGGTSPAVSVATTQQGVPTPAWTVVTQITPNSFYDLPAATLTAGDYEWQVRTYDALGLVGPYSSSAFFTAATVSNDITITAPTNGATISTSTFTVTWSTPTQTHYQLRVVADLAGVPDTATVIYDTGEIELTLTRSRLVSYPDNGVTRHTQVRKKQDGLWSDWASVSNLVSYTAPAVPSIIVDDTSLAGAIRVQATHPTPVGDEPTVSYVDVWRRETDDTGDGIRVATEVASLGIFADWFVASGVSYAYRVQAWGDNQTSSFSEWSEDGSGVVDEFQYGGY